MINLSSSSTLTVLLIISTVLFGFANCAIFWTANLGTSCDFVNNDFFNARTSKDDCQSKCNTTEGCTHFTWTNWNSGTCWMKKGIVEKDDAFSTTDPDMICGVMQNDSYTTPATTGETSTSITTTIVINQAGITSISRLMLFVMFLFHFLLFYY
ncbi:unnamed protein product [Adineta steineri]|uniref:Apple domain-containing protein n=1 Tax=Adineta steineri TaxID=433720 RepID=A0A813V741_9BILA|nr:unnamed protein product [Adineta steineri]CAF1354546.1 unnamed protein product [Adineta steineri]